MPIIELLHYYSPLVYISPPPRRPNLCLGRSISAHRPCDRRQFTRIF